MRGRIRLTGGVGAIATARGGASLAGEPDFIAVTTTSNSSSGAVTFNKPDGATAGDILLFSIFSTTMGLHAPPSGIKRLGAYQNASRQSLEIFAGVLGGSEGATFSFPVMSAGTRLSVCAAYRPRKGLEQYLDQMVEPILEQGGSSGITFGTPTFTPRRNSKLIFIATAAGGTAAILSPPAGSTKRAEMTTAAGKLYFFDAPASKNTPISKSGTWSVAHDNRMTAALLL